MTFRLWFGAFSRCVYAWVYYCTVLLGRGVTVSIAVMLVILLLRRTLFCHAVFGRGMLWGLLPLCLFVGKLTCIYQTHIGAVLLFGWHNFCAAHPWFCWLYIAGILFFGIYLSRRRRGLRRHIRTLPVATICGQKVYVSDTAMSPFTAGVFRPRIVLPAQVVEKFNQEELEAIILHEKTHIRLGHLWFYLLWDTVRMLLWLNPLVHICVKYFQTDLEEICDWVTMQNGRQSPYDYGRLLIKSMKAVPKDNRNMGRAVAFAGEQQYRQFKRRIMGIADYRPYNRKKMAAFLAFGIALYAFLAGGIVKASYPRYTVIDSWTVYDQTGKQALVEDSEELHSAVHIAEENIYVDMEAFRELLPEANRKDDMAVLFFDSFYKLPGIGGGGNAAIIDLKDKEQTQVIPYIKGDKDIFIWLFKYL